MCSLLLLLLLLIKDSSCSSTAVSVDIIIVRSGEAVQLSTDLTQAENNRLHDLQWQLPNGQLKNTGTGSSGERCQLLANGSLSFSRTETQDSGRYLMRAFDKDGKQIRRKEILLQVRSGESQPSMTSDL